MNRPTVRWYERVLDTRQVGEADHGDWYPIHFAGAALFAENASANPVTLYLDDSPDGVMWSPVLFSTHTYAGMVSITLQEHCCVALMFVTAQRYFRIRLGAACPEGVYCWLVEYPPIPREEAVYY